MMPSIDEIRNTLDYDPLTGLLTWKVRRGGKATIGRIAGNATKRGHIHLKLNDISMKGHRVAWAIVHGRWPKKHLDHINGNPADNRIENLRECDDLLNNQNQRQAHSNNKSGYLGVHFAKSSKKFRAQIRFDGKKHLIGEFSTAEEAAEAYLLAKRRFHPFNTI